MSEETNATPIASEEIKTEPSTIPEEEEDLSEVIFTKERPKKEKNPNRVRAGFKVGAIGQQRKEEIMRERVKKEMYKPTTWITVGIVLTSIGFLGLYFSPLFPKEKEKIIILEKKEEKKKEKPKESSSYFG